jgi:hypothetical protein
LVPKRNQKESFELMAPIPMLTADPFQNYSSTKTDYLSTNHPNRINHQFNPHQFSSNGGNTNGFPLNNNNNNNNNDKTSFMNNSFNFNGNREENIIEALKGSNQRKHLEILDELTTKALIENVTNVFDNRNLKNIYTTLGTLLISSKSFEVQIALLKLIQIYLNSFDKSSTISKKISEHNNNSLKLIDNSICDHLVSYLVIASVFPNNQLKQLAIDSLQIYLKSSALVSPDVFNKLISNGIESQDAATSRRFTETTLYILITNDLNKQDFTPIVQSLVKQLANPLFETGAIKCLAKIESVIKNEAFSDTINKLPANIRSIYTNTKNSKSKNQKSKIFSSFFSHFFNFLLIFLNLNNRY